MDKSHPLLIAFTAFILGFLCASGIILQHTQYKLADNNAKLEKAVDDEYEAEMLSAKYEFALQRIGVMLQNRCNKEK